MLEYIAQIHFFHLSDLLGEHYTLSHYTEDGISETKSSGNTVCLNSKIAYICLTEYVNIIV